MKKALLAIAAIASIASVQADAFDRQVASIVLLQNQAVQKDMKLTESQRTKMNVFAEKFNNTQKAYLEELKKQSNGGKTQPKRDQNREMKMVSDLKTQVLNILTDNQIVRLRQISLQAIGVAALADDTVAKRVGLNTTQITKVRSIVQKGLADGQKVNDDAVNQAKKGIKEPKTEAEQKKAQEAFQKNWKNIGPGAQKKLDFIRNKSIADVLAVLTPGQKTVWKGLIGPEFKG